MGHFILPDRLHFSLQEFLSESENGQHKLNTMVSKGELLSTLLTKEKASGIQAKIATAKEDWKNFHSNLHQKESALEVQYSQPCGYVRCRLLLLSLLFIKPHFQHI